MTTPRLIGPLAHRFRRDEEGHRYYEIDWHIATTSQHQNIAHILSNWPLFAVGSPFVLTGAWPEAVGTDLWAFCTPELNIAPHRDVKEYAGVFNWVVTQFWSTKQSWRCHTFPIENPLLEPKHITGDFVHEQRSTNVDRFGKPLLHPNFQPITGPATERRYSYPTVTISWNQSNLPLSTIVNLINKVNDAELWGLPARRVRFSDAKFERKVYGSCSYYWNVAYTFEFDEKGFDIPVPAEGTKVYSGSGSPYDPRNFIPAKSDTDENESIPLDYLGRRLVFRGINPTTGQAEYLYGQHVQTPEVIEQGNLLLLDIPATLG